MLSVPRRAHAVLSFDVGQRVEVSGRGVIGRNPQDPRAAGSQGVSEPLAHVIPLEDPQRSISKTHLEFGLAGTSFWVTDLHSTNGVHIIDSHGERRLDPGVSTVVPPGTTVRFGERTFTLGPAAPGPATPGTT